MEDILFSRFSELMTVKNQLIIADKNWLIDTYKDANDETLEMLFEGLILMFKYDEPFFYLKEEYLEKVVGFISEMRGMCGPQHLQAINEIIVAINNVKSKKQTFKSEELKKYINLQQHLRDSYLDEEILIASFSYDALVLNGILYRTLDRIKEKDFVLASMNYLMQICPSFFVDDDIKAVVSDELDKIKSGKGLTRVIKKYAKDTKKMLNGLD